MIPRGLIAVTAVGTAIAGLIVTGRPHHHRPAPAHSANLAPVVPLARTSRGDVREPLSAVNRKGASPRKGTPRPAVHRRARPAADSGTYADTTMYCSTGNRNAAGHWPRLGDVAVADRSIPFGTRVTIAGNVYRVEDWIGYGSQFDIFGGDDDGCEQRALNYGRRHLRVVVER